MQLKYKRVLIKVSGEAMAGEQHFGLDFDTVLKICESIKECVSLGAEVAVVVGGGNFWRGRTSGKMDRTRADHMGMLATVINALALGDALEQLGVDVRVQTAISMQQVAEPYIRNKAVRHLEKGRVVVFGCGTGNPFFSTDTAASLRAAEIDADIIFKATNVDGVYDCDPKHIPKAKSMTNSNTLMSSVKDFTLWTAQRPLSVWIIIFPFSYSILTTPKILFVQYAAKQLVQ